MTNKEQRSKRERLTTQPQPKRLKARFTAGRTCKPTGKLSWKTEYDANLALGQTLRRIPGSKQEKRAYKCEHGEHWHLTSKEHSGHAKEETNPPRDRSGFDRVLGRGEYARPSDPDVAADGCCPPARLVLRLGAPVEEAVEQEVARQLAEREREEREAGR